MANGYSQIYGYSTFTVFNLWKYKYNPLIVACVVVASASTLGAGLRLISNTEKKKVNYGSNRSFSFCYNCSNRRCNLLQPPRQEKGSKSQMRKELVVFPFLP